MAACTALAGSSARGSATMQTVSATATCTTVATTRSPMSPAPSITGITRRGRTGRQQHRVEQAMVRYPANAAMARPAGYREHSGAGGQRKAAAQLRTQRSLRTGTWLPATNMTRANPADARKDSTGSSGLTQPNPVRPATHADQDLADHDRECASVTGWRAADLPGRSRGPAQGRPGSLSHFRLLPVLPPFAALAGPG